MHFKSISFRQLPITLEDGEAFGKEDTMFSFDCWRPRDDDVLKQSAEQIRLNVVNGTRQTETEAETDTEANV